MNNEDTLYALAAIGDVVRRAAEEATIARRRLQDAETLLRVLASTLPALPPDVVPTVKGEA